MRGRPVKSFWVWLDCPNYEINGHSPNFVDLPTCPRTKLESETVHYVTEKAERDSYAVVIGDDGIFRSRRPQALLPDLGPGATVAALACTSIAAPSTLQPIVTGEHGWIFVLREDTLYAGPKVTETAPRYGHEVTPVIPCLKQTWVLLQVSPHIFPWRRGVCSCRHILYIFRHAWPACADQSS